MSTAPSQGSLGLGDWVSVHRDTALAPLRFSLVSLCGVCLFWGPERREQLVLFKGLCNQQGKDQITIAEIFIIAEAGPPAV